MSSQKGQGVQYEKIYTEDYKEIYNIKPRHAKGIFDRMDKGLEILADVLNGKLTYADVEKIAREQGLKKGTTQQNIGNTVKKIREQIEVKGDNIMYVPFVTQDTAAGYLEAIEQQINRYGEPGIKVKVDPIQGLHQLIKIIDDFSKAQVPTYKERMATVHLKASLYEKIYKLDSESRGKFDKNKILSGLDKLSGFVKFAHDIINETFDVLLMLIGDRNSDQLLYSLKHALNIKELYLEYIETVEIAEEEIEQASN